MAADVPRASLSELLAALSLATDVGNGFPTGRTLRVCLLSLRLARELGVEDAAALADVYFLAMLRSIACTASAPEQATAFGSDTDGSRWSQEADIATVPRGSGFAEQLCLANWDVGRRFAERLGLGPVVVGGIGQVWERFDGRGRPHGVGGEQLPLATRIMHVAGVAETQLRELGPDEAVAAVRRRSGGQLDPAVADAFAVLAKEGPDTEPVGAAWEKVLAAEPGGPRPVDRAALDATVEVFADFADLKSRFTAGHSRRTAALTRSALGKSESAHETALGALLHDLGRVGVPTAVWDKPGPLNALEWDLVRSHPAITDQIIGRCELLADLARHASAHHETPDGRGYPRGIPTRSLPFPARVVAAASAWSAMTADRAHRPALTPTRAAEELRAEARSGRFDAAAVDAVLGAAGVAAPRGGGTQGLTDRESEVLTLLASGWPVKQVARALGISHATARHHVEHIYAKLGVASRAGAVLAAVERGLVG